jgi:hypothetical protein
MTKDKASKRDVRARMAKTGERYTSARATAKSAEPWVTDDLGQSDDAIRRGSGKGWKEWIRILDAWGARERSHTEIARHVSGELGVTGWWAQAVTVGYERARGLRAPNQKSDGYCAYASKTVYAPVDELAEAFTKASARRRWLDPGTLQATSSTGRSARFSAPGSTRVLAYFEDKGPGTSQVSIQHERLDGPDDVATWRAFWRERLSRLATTIDRR